MMRTTLSILMLLLWLEPSWAIPVSAQDDVPGGWSPFTLSQDSDEVPEREPGPATLEEAIEIAVKRYGGQATRSETVVRDGQRVHEVRVFGEDGIVRTVRIDPDTGEIIPQRR